MATVTIALETGPRWGTGHAVRMASIAGLLAANHDVIVLTPTPKLVRRIFRMFEIDVAIRGGTFSVRRLSATAADLYILDHLETDSGFVAALRATPARVATFDDRGTGAERADLVVNAIFGRWGARAGVRSLEGPRYLVLSPAFHGARIRQGTANVVHRVVVALGGLTPLRETRFVTKAVGRGIAVVSMAGFNDTRARPSALTLAQADLAITNGGLSMYESIGLGVPTIALPRTDDEARSISRASRRGAVVSASEETLPATVARLVADVRSRASLSARGQSLVDGKGDRRVLAALESLL